MLSISIVYPASELNIQTDIHWVVVGNEAINSCNEVGEITSALNSDSSQTDRSVALSLVPSRTDSALDQHHDSAETRYRSTSYNIYENIQISGRIGSRNKPLRSWIWAGELKLLHFFDRNKWCWQLMRWNRSFHVAAGDDLFWPHSSSNSRSSRSLRRTRVDDKTDYRSSKANAWVRSRRRLLATRTRRQLVGRRTDSAELHAWRTHSLRYRLKWLLLLLSLHASAAAATAALLLQLSCSAYCSWIRIEYIGVRCLATRT